MLEARDWPEVEGNIIGVERVDSGTGDMFCRYTVTYAPHSDYDEIYTIKTYLNHDWEFRCVAEGNAMIKFNPSDPDDAYASVEIAGGSRRVQIGYSLFAIAGAILVGLIIMCVQEGKRIERLDEIRDTPSPPKIK